MTWQKVARVVVAVIGVGTAGAVYFTTRDRTPPAPPPVLEDADPAAKMQAGAGKDLRYREDELLGTLTYESVRSYENNRWVWEKFRYEMKDGTVLSAGRVEASGSSMGGGKPDDMKLSQGVHLITQDGTELRGRSGTYSEVSGLANVPGKVSFARGTMSGTGNGGTYDRQAGVFRLLDDARVEIASGDEGGEPIHASARTMTYTRAAQSMYFEDRATLERSTDTMRGDQATLYLSPDEERIRLIELRGHASVAPVKGKTSALPEMRATDIDLTFHEGSQALQQAHLAGGATMHQPTPEGRRSIEGDRIDFTTAADGETLTQLSAQPADAKGRVTVRLPSAPGTPARTITGASLSSSGDEARGLTSAVFQGGVEFVETSAGRGGGAGARRVGKSRTLRLAIKGALDQIEEARFEQAVEITDGDVKGFGDVGVYRAASGEMDLTPNRQTPGKKATVINGDAGMTVEAVEIITAYLNTSGIYARGEVTTATRASSKGKTASNSIFNESDPIYGSAAEFRYDDAANVATYDGKGSATARVTQKSNLVIGDHIEYYSERQDLIAKGHVDSTFDIAPSAGDAEAKTSKPAPGSYRAEAEMLHYTEKTRVARYTGSVRLRNADGETTADVMELFLAKDARTLDRLEATGRVHATLQKDREARGDRLVYEAREDLYQLWGKPLTLTNRENDGTCYAQEGTMARFKGELGAPDFPADQNAAGGAPRRSIPCPMPASPK